MKKLATAILLALVTGTAGPKAGSALRGICPRSRCRPETDRWKSKGFRDTDHEISGEWARTSRPCPEFCIQPYSPAEDVTTIGELELLEMLKDPEAVVVDSRTPDWFEGGTIPGAINIPYTYVVDELARLGCEPDFDGWNCDGRQIGGAVLQRTLVWTVAERDPQHDQGRLSGGPHFLLPGRHAGLATARPDGNR